MKARAQRGATRTLALSGGGQGRGRHLCTGALSLDKALLVRVEIG